MFKFGTSGIRDLTENLLKDQIAKQLAQTLSKKGWQSLTIGRDGRTGSDQLMDEFIANFTGTVNNLGITTTPELASQSGLAVMITASHNPCQYCGFKIYLNHQEQSTADLDPIPVYNKWHDIPKDIVIDCANGGLGHKLKSLGFNNLINTDGEINQSCGATHPENLENYCKTKNLEIGFGVDGDADRFLVYLHDHVLTSEETALLIAKLSHLTTIVVDETVNSGLAEHLTLVRSKVGGHSVIAAMRDHNVNFGAEKSGHYYFDKNIGTSDSVDAMITLSKGYHDLGIDGLMKILATYHPYHQVVKNVEMAKLPDTWETILNQIKLPASVRQVIRKSGTEPLLRIMLESQNQTDIDTAWETISTALKIK